MGKSWELTEKQKKEIQEQQAEIGAQYDPETGQKKGETEKSEIMKMSKVWKMSKYLAMVVKKTMMIT